MGTRNRSWVIGVVTGVVVLAAAGVWFAWRASPAHAGTIRVTGSATVHSVPDTMSFQLGVTTTSSSASAALRQASGRLRSVEGVLRASGVRRADLQSSDVSIDDRTNSSGAVVSFSATETLSVMIHELAKAGAILDAATRVAGNEVQLYGLNYSLSSGSSALASARERAVLNARHDAAALARAASSTLGRVLSISASSAVPAPEFVATGSMFAAASNAAAVPVQPGVESVSAQVTIVYALGG